MPPKTNFCFASENANWLDLFRKGVKSLTPVTKSHLWRRHEPCLFFCDFPLEFIKEFSANESLRELPILQAKFFQLQKAFGMGIGFCFMWNKGMRHNTYITFITIMLITLIYRIFYMCAGIHPSPAEYECMESYSTNNIFLESKETYGFCQKTTLGFPMI